MGGFIIKMPWCIHITRLLFLENGHVNTQAGKLDGNAHVSHVRTILV